MHDGIYFCETNFQSAWLLGQTREVWIQSSNLEKKSTVPFSVKVPAGANFTRIHRQQWATIKGRNFPACNILRDACVALLPGTINGHHLSVLKFACTHTHTRGGGSISHNLCFAALDGDRVSAVASRPAFFLAIYCRSDHVFLMLLYECGGWTRQNCSETWWWWCGSIDLRCSSLAWNYCVVCEREPSALCAFALQPAAGIRGKNGHSPPPLQMDAPLATANDGPLPHTDEQPRRHLHKLLAHARGRSLATLIRAVIRTPKSAVGGFRSRAPLETRILKIALRCSFVAVKSAEFKSDEDYTNTMPAPLFWRVAL